MLRRCTSFAATGRGKVRAAVARAEGEWASEGPNERVKGRNADIAIAAETCRYSKPSNREVEVSEYRRPRVVGGKSFQRVERRTRRAV